MSLLLLYFVLAIGFSFLCSVLEAVLLSITPSYIRIKTNEGSKMAEDLKRFKSDIDRPLSAILTLNTIAHTVGAIGVGAQAAKVFSENSLQLFGFEVSMEGLIAALMTLAILILSEIIPKTIGANNWRALAPFTIQSLKVLNFVLYPFVFISQLITRGLKKEKEKSVLSRTDFLAMTYAVTEEGVIDEHESRIIHNILKWNDITARKIMTPRTVVVARPSSMTISECYESLKEGYSRIPIYTEAIDDIDGYILKDAVLEALVKGKGDEPISTIKRSILVIPETQFLDTAFQNLMERKEHIALVVDEFGGVEGLVTLEDIMETILGTEIMDESDKVPDLQKVAIEKAKRRLAGQ